MQRTAEEKKYLAACLRTRLCKRLRIQQLIKERKWLRAGPQSRKKPSQDERFSNSSISRSTRFIADWRRHSPGFLGTAALDRPDRCPDRRTRSCSCNRTAIPGKFCDGELSLCKPVSRGAWCSSTVPGRELAGSSTRSVEDAVFLYVPL